MILVRVKEESIYMSIRELNEILHGNLKKIRSLSKKGIDDHNVNIEKINTYSSKIYNFLYQNDSLDQKNKNLLNEIRSIFGQEKILPSRESLLLREIRNLNQKTDGLKKISFLELLALFDTINKYISYSALKEFNEQELEDIADHLADFYKMRREDFDGSRLGVLRESINKIIYHLDFLPIDNDGNEMNNIDFIEWKKNLK